LVSVFGFKDKQGNFRPTGGSGIYQKETSNKAVPTTTKTNFNLQLPGYRNFMQGRRDEMAYRKSTKETNKKINEKDKKAKEQLKLEFDENEKKIKDIRKQMDKGKISSGEAQLLVGKIMGGTTIKTGAMPSGKIELDEMGQHHKRILEKRIADNKKAQEDLTKQKSDNKTTKAKTATGSGNTSEDTKEWNDDLQKELEKLQKTETELELDLLKVTGVNPETEFNKNAVIPPIEKREKERSGSPGRVADSLEGSIPKEIAERRDQASKEYHEGLSGEPVPTFTTIPYQTRRIDPETGEFTSKLSDSKYEKQLKNMFAEAEKQGYYTNESLSNEQLAEALENISKNARIDPTQETPKGMGALIGLRAEMAGRSN
jgi:hypothetical protein